MVERKIAGGVHLLGHRHLPHHRHLRGSQVLSRETVRGQGRRHPGERSQFNGWCQRAAAARIARADLQSRPCAANRSAHGADGHLVRADADRDDVQCVADNGGDFGRRLRVFRVRLGATAFGGGGRALSLEFGDV